LLAALNTGHEGGAGTIHANTATDVVARIEALGALAGMSLAAVHAQLVSAVAVVVQVRRCGRQRLIESIGVVMAGPGERPLVVPVLDRGRGASMSDDPAQRGCARERLAALVGTDGFP
jgi:pilus assembly protein CpaF